VGRGGERADGLRTIARLAGPASQWQLRDMFHLWMRA
jgi:hypothetical protein